MSNSTGKTERSRCAVSIAAQKSRSLIHLKTLALLLPALLLGASSVLAGVMMQGFYWNTPANWYNTMSGQAAGLKNMTGGYGINRIWFPVPDKSASGGYSMGYDPFDYYDLGSYSQNGGPGTHFGTQAQLKSAIAAYKAQSISCLADIVLNHRSGGKSEANTYTGGSSYTDFSGAASGKCLWHWDSFHPNFYHVADEGTFGGYPDICYQAGSAYNDMKAWLVWLESSSNAGFDGWRYDYCKGYDSWTVHDMNAASSPTFTVGEYWDTDCNLVDTWVSGANSSAFDFPLYYTMQTVCDNTGGGGNLADFINSTKCYAAKNPTRAVTFCANHDTDLITSDKMLGYAFILTYQGYPCIFWQDYFNYGMSTNGAASPNGWGNGIKQLVWCREKLAGGAPSIQVLNTSDPQVLIYGAGGTSASSPGYIIIINSSPSAWKGYTVTTSDTYLKGKTLKAYAWASTVSGNNTDPNNQNCDSSGNVQVWAAPRGYAVYSVNGL